MLEKIKNLKWHFHLMILVTIAALLYTGVWYFVTSETHRLIRVPCHINDAAFVEIVERQVREVMPAHGISSPGNLGSGFRPVGEQT